MTASTRSDGWVYFAEKDGLIKIGWTRHVGQRMANLGAHLLAVEPGTRFNEAQAHSRFRLYRQQGEWFDDTPEIRAYIETLPSYERLHAS